MQMRFVAPLRERELKPGDSFDITVNNVAPLRERELKPDGKDNGVSLSSRSLTGA